MERVPVHIWFWLSLSLKANTKADISPGRGSVMAGLTSPGTDELMNTTAPPPTWERQRSLQLKSWLHVDRAQLSRRPVKPHIMNSHKMILIHDCMFSYLSHLCINFDALELIKAKLANCLKFWCHVFVITHKKTSKLRLLSWLKVGVPSMLEP